jgi:hypothetical protein
MKNTAINTLGYTGIVTLSQYIGSKKVEIAKVHNAGGKILFDFLSDCLIGDFDIAKINRPTKIMLLNCYDKEDESTGSITPVYESVSGFIYLLTKPEKVFDAKNGVVRYSFSIPRSQLEGGSMSFNSIGLYANSTTALSPEDFAAVCKVDITPTDISMSSALVVDWELYISNKKEEISNVS